MKATERPNKSGYKTIFANNEKTDKRENEMEVFC